MIRKIIISIALFLSFMSVSFATGPNYYEEHMKKFEEKRLAIEERKQKEEAYRQYLMERKRQYQDYLIRQAIVENQFKNQIRQMALERADLCLNASISYMNTQEYKEKCRR